MDFTSSSDRLELARIVKENINEHWSIKRPNRQSTRLSPSWLGEECAAQSWYRWRWAAPIEKSDGRMARYNSRGETNEHDVAEWLRATGWVVEEIDPATGEQWAISDFNGHMYGKSDGRAYHPELTDGRMILLEYKYINKQRFAALTSKPLIEADFKYYCQVCLYMHYMNLPACMFLPAGRNDEDIQPVIIPADPAQVVMLQEKATTIATSKVRPARIAESAAFFKCKFCDYKENCHEGKELMKSCRSCEFIEPIAGGKFHCNKWNATIPNKQAIIDGCDQWQPVK